MTGPEVSNFVGAPTEDRRPPFPPGWFMVAGADDISPGEVIGRTRLGEEVAAFREADGRVAVPSAFCPHLGADMGFGGKVVDGALRCPFHSLRWNGTGRCVGSEYPNDPPYPETLAKYPTFDRFGYNFGWSDPHRRPPHFDIPDLDLDGWTEPLETTIEIAVPPETVRENGVDGAHFGVMRGFWLSDTRYEDRGTSFHSESNVTTPNFLRTGAAEFATFFDTDTCGLGYARSLNTAEAVGLRYRVLLLTVPGRLDFTAVTMDARPADGLVGGLPVEEVGDFVHRGAVGGVRQDVWIWEHVRFLDNPRLVRGDGPFPRFRRWAQQFRPDGQASSL